jgi:hypothetical protein
MGLLGIGWLVVCALGVAVSLKSIGVLREPSRWTAIGWCLTVAYFVLAIPRAWGASAPLHVEYVALAGLIVAFVVAGRRDEPQAEPWWWPTHTGLTGAQRRAGK